MCRKVIALYDLCYDTPSRPSTCSSSRPVCSPPNDVYFGLQRCPQPSLCREEQFQPTIYLPLVARTCSNACERELNLEYWTERQRMRRKEYNPFLDRMLCLGRDARLYHVVTGECVAGEEQFGDDPPVEREAYVGMLPPVPWEDGGEASRGNVGGNNFRPGPSASNVEIVRDGEDRGRGRVEFGSGSRDDSSSQVSRRSTWQDYRSHLRALKERGGGAKNEAKGEGEPSLEERGSHHSWLGRHLVRSKSKKCLISHES